MNINKFRLIVFCFASLFLVSACSTPNLYRPEVDTFQKATSEIDSYVKARKENTENVRNSNRIEYLEHHKPLIKLADECPEAVSNLNMSANDGSIPNLKLAANCNLETDGNEKEINLNDREKAFENTVAFAEALGVYASSLDKVAKCGNKEAFLEASKGLGEAVISLAGSAAEAANMEKPKAETFTPIADLLAQSAYYYLETQKTKALQEAAKEAQSWIELGSEAVVKVMLSSQFEIASSDVEKVRYQIDKVNEAKDKDYVSEAEKAIKYTFELKQQLDFDSALPFRKLPATHRKLLDSFKDRKRYLAGAIAVAQDLYGTAKDAHDAIKERN